MNKDYKLLEFVEIDRLDEILQGFTAVTGVSSFIVSPNGNPISKEYNWSRLCSDFCRSTEKGRLLCYRSDRYGAAMSARLKRRVCYTCLNAGLVDCTSPVIVGNYHIANVMCGQILHEPIPEPVAINRAKNIGIKDIDGYIQALQKVPIISNERLETIIDFMAVVAKTISELAWNKYVSSKRSNRYLNWLVNRVSDGIISLDTDGKISMVNDSFSDTIGFKKNQIIGEYFKKYIPDKECLEKYQKALQLVDKDGHGRVSLTLCGNDGKKVAAQVSIDKNEQKTAGSFSYVAVLRDVSEEMRIESLKEDLIGMMTHDLRNPIFSIQKAMQLLASGAIGSLTAKQAELIHLSEKTTSQLFSMVMDYLDIYRHENGKLRLRKEILNVPGIIRESIKQMELIAKEKNISIRFYTSSENINIIGDRLRIIRICSNLLANAINFGPAGSEIEIRNRYVNGSDIVEMYESPENPFPQELEYLLIEIIDHGPGIEKGTEKIIFDKFSTLRRKDTSNRHGVGLGLAFCKLAVEAHNGYIGVKSPFFGNNKLDFKGSCFYFYLPAGTKVKFESIGMEF